MRICDDCGAQNHVRDEWQGGDVNCIHFHRTVLLAPDLAAEIKLLMSKYTPTEIIKAAEDLGGAKCNTL